MNAIVTPFRWNIHHPSQRGPRAFLPREELCALIEADLQMLGALVVQRDDAVDAYTWLTRELTTVGAHVLAASYNADLFFVGRSVESLFDLLHGCLSVTSWHDRPHLLFFSSGSEADQASRFRQTYQRRALEDYLRTLELTPTALIQRSRPVALVDIVHSGATMIALMRFFANWSEREGIAWKQLRKQIRIIGLTERTKTSPNTRRWQQQPEWTAIHTARAVRNIPLSALCFHYLGAAQPKTTASYHPGRWLDPTIGDPRRDPEAHTAVQLAGALYDTGRSPLMQRSLAQEMAPLQAMRYAWFRDLRQQLAS
jgi:hypothetical protein